MSQATVNTTTTTTQSVTIVCSGAPITVTVTMASTFVGQRTLDQHNVVLPPQLILRATIKGYVGPTTVPQPQQPQSQLCHGSSTGDFSLQFHILYVSV